MGKKNVKLLHEYFAENYYLLILIFLLFKIII